MFVAVEAFTVVVYMCFLIAFYSISEPMPSVSFFEQTQRTFSEPKLPFGRKVVRELP